MKELKIWNECGMYEFPTLLMPVGSYKANESIEVPERVAGLSELDL